MASVLNEKIEVDCNKTRNVERLEKINTLFFDLDNTLIPTRSGDVKACREIAGILEDLYGVANEESTAATEYFLKHFRKCPDNSKNSLQSWRTSLWREALPARHQHLAEEVYPKWLQARYRHLALSGDFIEMLENFREIGFMLALITNGPSHAQWEKIDELRVRPYFDCVLVSSDLPWEKPNPNIFHAACDYLGVKPLQCAMIGDKLESDIKGGCLSNLGATFWLPLVNPAEVDLKDIEYQPDFVLNHLLDLYKYFPNLSATKTSTNANANAKNLDCSNYATKTGTTTKATVKVSSESGKGDYHISSSRAWIST